jgi:hypothetical protein
VTADAPLERMPIWQKPDQLVAMFARAADTLEPATAPGVTSYADPAYGRELRVVVAESGTLTLHDGATAEVAGGTRTFTPGDQYDIVTFDERRAAAPAGVTVDGAALPAAADAAALETCAAPGCWFHDATAGRLRIRVHATDGATHTIAE